MKQLPIAYVQNFVTVFNVSENPLENTTGEILQKFINKHPSITLIPTFFRNKAQLSITFANFFQHCTKSHEIPNGEVVYDFLKDFKRATIKIALDGFP